MMHVHDLKMCVHRLLLLMHVQAKPDKSHFDSERVSNALVRHQKLAKGRSKRIALFADPHSLQDASIPIGNKLTVCASIEASLLCRKHRRI